MVESGQGEGRRVGAIVYLLVVVLIALCGIFPSLAEAAVDRTNRWLIQGSQNAPSALDQIRAIAEIIGLIVGGLWAYYKFFKGRTFRPRLELAVSGDTWQANALTHLRACIEIKNVGLSKLELSQKGSGLRVFSQTPAQGSSGSPSVVEWQRLMTLPVFEKHKWIEPGETIADETLISIGAVDGRAVKLELRIVANGIEWNSRAILEPDTSQEKGHGAATSKI